MIEVRKIREEEKEIFKDMFYKYHNELSQYSTRLRDINLTDEYIEKIFNYEYSQKMFLVNDNEVVGFCIVDLNGYERSSSYYFLDEFYILPEYRRKRYGTEAIESILTEFQGEWHMYILKDNLIAQKFWCNVFNSINYDVIPLEEELPDDCLLWWVSKR